MKLHADIQNMDDIMSKLKELVNDNNNSSFFSGINEIKRQLEDLNTNAWKGSDSTTFYNNYLAYLEYMKEVFTSYQKLVLMIDDASDKYRDIDDLKNYYVEDKNTFNMADSIEKVHEDDVIKEGD